MPGQELMDVGLGLEGTHVVVTGAKGYIGSVVARAFLSAGCYVSALDIRFPEEEVVDTDEHGRAASMQLHIDIKSEASVETAFRKCRSRFGPVSVAVALGALDLSVVDHHVSSINMTVEQWRRVIDVNVTGTFLTARQWLRGLEEHRNEETAEKKELHNVSLIIIGSESGRFGERSNSAYSTSKSAVQGGLMLSFAADAPRVWEGARYVPKFNLAYSNLRLRSMTCVL